MRYVWLAILVVSFVPVALASLLLNPFVYLLLGPNVWRERVARLYPYRWWIGASLFALALSATVYATQFA
jgi:hypothetical protein